MASSQDPPHPRKKKTPRTKSGRKAVAQARLVAWPQQETESPATSDLEAPLLAASEPQASLDAARLMPASAALAPALHLLPFQRRWIEDNSLLKIVVKARQIGYSFAATLRAVFQCMGKKTTWVFLSKGERQSRLLMEKVQEHIRTCGIVAQTFESTFFENTLIRQLETRFPNGSVIYGLPANPDTARGYSGNVTLDEFAFHVDADKIYSALYPTITRGYGLEVISTPNGQQGKFYELAKATGLLREGSGGQGPVLQSPDAFYRGVGGWSAHWCDIEEAARQGLKIDLSVLRAGCDDESAWQQEYCCQFVSTAENFFPPELIAACLSSEASTDTPFHVLTSAGAAAGGAVGPRAPGQTGRGEFFLGIDVGRHHDRSVFWMDEVLPLPLPVAGMAGEAMAGSAEFARRADHALSAPWLGGRKLPHLSVTRLVRTLTRVPFVDQLVLARQLLSVGGGDGQPLVRRASIDSTGMGAPLAEALAGEFGPRVEPVVFTALVKEDLAFRTKRRMENRLSLLPDTREVRRAFSAVKKIVTPSGNLRFDAERTEAGHADEFWAKALADLAAEGQPHYSLDDAGLVGSARETELLPARLGGLESIF